MAADKTDVVSKQENAEGMLSPYRILDLTDEKGLFCGQLLGSLGADVIKIEKRGGDSARNIGPFLHDIPDGETNIPEYGHLWHFTESYAQRVGQERAFISGGHMECWLTTLVTNWMGDAGFLKRFSVRYRTSLLFGTTAICKGEVVRKYVEGDQHLIDLKVTLEDHEGTKSIPDGSATVVLPSREALASWAQLASRS